MKSGSVFPAFLSFYGLLTQWNFNVKSYLWNIYFGVYRLKTSHFPSSKFVLRKCPKSFLLHPEWLGLVDFIREQLQWIRSANAAALRRMFISEQPDWGIWSSTAPLPKCFLELETLIDAWNAVGVFSVLFFSFCVKRCIEPRTAVACSPGWVRVPPHKIRMVDLQKANTRKAKTSQRGNTLKVERGGEPIK